MSKRIILLTVFAMLVAGSAIAGNATPPQEDDPAQEVVFPNQTFGQFVECRNQPLQYFRPINQCGLNIFETSKFNNDVPFDGFKVDWSGGFTQEVQFLKHSNDPTPPAALEHIGWGFGRASANAYMHAQLADGIRMQLSVYLSSRHHTETWVKDGYVQMDKSPIDLGPFNVLWERFVTLKVGHMEVNYGDAHFRRTDNGNGMYNPFVENYLIDAFATEVGAEAYLHPTENVMLMGAITGGEIRGSVQNRAQSNLAFIWKAAYDNQVNDDLRVRMSFSNYINNESPANTLFRGDRAGSHYWCVLEAEGCDVVSDAFSARVNPDFRNKVRAYQFNPFVKYRGLELFGVVEHAMGARYPYDGGGSRTFNQYAVDAIYRFMDDKMYGGVRYNYVDAHLRGYDGRVSVNRFAVGGGWFPLPYLLLKGEFVRQEHCDYPVDDRLHDAQFHGIVVQAALGF